MTKILNLIYAIALMLVVNACANADASAPRSANFDEGWKFNLGDSAAYSQPDFNDSSWRSLNLPHDWAIEGDFSKENPSGTGGGALPGGIGWYRKTFTVPGYKEGEKVYIDFDGAYMNTTVYINGHELGTRPYGYASFSYDITPWLKEGDNVIAVKVDNSDQPNSRWYSGCGIYRHVWLRKLDAIHVAQWGTYVTTSDITPDSATVNIATTVDNTSAADAEVTLTTRVIDPQGKVAATVTASDNIAAGKSATVNQTARVADPQLWSLDNPALYSVVTDVAVGGKTVDTYQTTTGIRTIEFTADKGFFLNGEQMKINGVCMHHDLGALGAAVNTRAIRRQLEILQEMGVNAYRASHNPPAPEVLALCDSMGILVMDEAFDMWRKRKTERDYARFFDEWHERDLTDLVTRDRNHPSIIMWSIGNEVLEQWSDAAADTLSLEEANLILNFGHGADKLAKDGDEMSVNSMLTAKLADIVKQLDPTRPVTAGMNEPNPGNHLIKSGALDVIGLNYHDEWYDDAEKNYPGKPLLGSETVSALMTRGYYKNPSDSIIIAPKRWDIPYEDPSFACSAYDNEHVPWGTTHENSLRRMKDDRVMGQFIWTGFDYIGEPTPYGWPARSSYFGIVDLAGFPKDVYYMYQSEWRPDKTVLHLFPHWNWTPGQTVDLLAYYNNADEVELFVNGKSQGVRSKGDGEYHVMWRVPFEPGTIKAVSRKAGKTVAEQVIKTAGEPAQIRLTPDRATIAADGNDLSFVTVEILDSDGNLCPTAVNEVTFTVEGAGQNEGVDNGNPISLERFKADSRKAMAGKALLIVRNNGKKGDINVKAVSPGLSDATVTLKAK
ncbi:MAG: DUF4982 domain-containing protein [Candidatus Homeothermus sp.]|nr:DUF4982 domain-containing protein [Candidatus Homeothermus sp.]